MGCDGAHSQVREQAGIASGGADFDQRMILAVFRSRELHEHLDRFPLRTTYRVLHPGLNGYWWFFGGSTRPRRGSSTRQYTRTRRRPTWTRMR